MTVDTETTTATVDTALGATTPEAAVPATAVPEAAVPAVAQQAQASQNIVIPPPVYVCKKHAAGVAYISIDGASFCSLCLKRFLERYVKPMTKLETKVVPVAAAGAVKETP